MYRIGIAFLVASLALTTLASVNFAQRGGRGGGPSGGGGGFTSPARTVQAAPSVASSTRNSGVGPGGSTFQSASGSGSITTSRGATVDYKGAAVGGSTAGGVSEGRYVGGVQVTGPGGQTATKAGRGVAATGPGGVTVAGRTGVAVTPRGTYYRSAAAISGQGVTVRAACRPYYGYFSPRWYAQYPGAWFAAGWVANTAWRAATWDTLSSTCGYETEADYDYGSTVVFQDDTVYFNGDAYGSTEEYVQQATAIADAGREAKVQKEGEWLPLGVFAMVQGEEQTSNNIFQLAVNKEGILRGTYYNALTDSTETVVGSVAKKTQRAAWTVGDKKTPVYEAGIANLTNDQTTMMVHYGKDRSQQFTLFRIEKPEEGSEK